MSILVWSGGSNTCFKALPQGGPTPTLIKDLSGHGNHGAFTVPPEPILINGKWCYQFVSGSSEYVTVPDITELLGATAATWCAWVRKDAYVQYQCVASDYSTAGGQRKWSLVYEVADGTARMAISNDGVAVKVVDLTGFTAGWHFLAMRFVGSTSLEGWVDNAYAVNTDAIMASLNNTVGQNHTYIGRTDSYYSSISLGALAIWPSAITDAEIQKWRYQVKALLGL